MNNKIKSKLLFSIGAMAMLTIAVSACNGSGENKEAKKDSPVVEMPVTVVRDSTDSMESSPGNVSPVVETKPKS